MSPLIAFIGMCNGVSSEIICNLQLNNGLLNTKFTLHPPGIIARHHEQQCLLFDLSRHSLYSIQFNILVTNQPVDKMSFTPSKAS